MAKSLQIRLDTSKTHPDIKEWANNQKGSANDSLKTILQHFIRIHGTGDVNSMEVKNKMNLYELKVSGLITEKEFDEKIKSFQQSTEETVDTTEDDSKEQKKDNTPKDTTDYKGKKKKPVDESKKKEMNF